MKKKVFFFLLFLFFTVGSAVVILNQPRSFEKKSLEVKSNFLLHKSSYEEVVLLIKKNKSHDVDLVLNGDKWEDRRNKLKGESIDEISIACKKIHDKPESISFQTKEKRITFRYTYKIGYKDYMQVDIMYYDDIPTEYKENSIDEHWVIQVYGLV